MEEKTWPPAPSEAKPPSESATVQTDLTVCPTCGRKLLTLRSALCNWCGAVISDEAYQQRAAAERAAVDAAVRQQIDREMDETARYGVIGRLKKINKGGRAGAPRRPLDDLLGD